MRVYLGGDKDILFLLSAIVLISILFIKAPYEAEYLIPATPFGLLFINRICRRRELIVFLCILLLSNSFVSFCTVKRNNEGKIVIHTIDDGMIKRNIEGRTEQLDFTQSLMNVKINHSVVIIGWYLPILSYLDKNTSYSKDSKIIGDADHDDKKMKKQALSFEISPLTQTPPQKPFILVLSFSSIASTKSLISSLSRTFFL